MAELKRRTLILSSGKQIKLYGTSLAIGRSLEIGEGYAPNIIAASGGGLVNPHHLSIEELMEVADYSMQLWMDLKNNLRKHGLDAGKLFVEAVR